MSQESINKRFLSYAREDSDFALKLARDLRASHVELWVDQLDIPRGEPWDTAVERALKQCAGLIVVLSPTAVGSSNVMDEVSFALDKQKKILPVLYRPCEIPFRLKRLQYVSFLDSYEQGVTEVVAALSAGPSSSVVIEERRPVQVPQREGRSKVFASFASKRILLTTTLIALVALATVGWIAKSRWFDTPVADHYVGANGSYWIRKHDGWVEKAIGRPDVSIPFQEVRHDSTYIYLVDRSRLKDGDINNPLLLRLPMAGGDAQWAWSNPMVWTALTIVQPSNGKLPEGVAERPPPPIPKNPIEGIWDIEITCPDQSSVREPHARFVQGRYARTFTTPQGVSGRTELAVGFASKDTILVDGWIAFGQTVSPVSATGQRANDVFIGQGTFGTGTDCKLLAKQNS